MNKFVPQVVSAIAAGVTAAGVGTIVGNVIKNNTMAVDKTGFFGKVTKVRLGIGAVALTAIAATAASEYVDKQVMGMFETFDMGVKLGESVADLVNASKEAAVKLTPEEYGAAADYATEDVQATADLSDAFNNAKHVNFEHVAEELNRDNIIPETFKRPDTDRDGNKWPNTDNNGDKI